MTVEVSTASTDSEPVVAVADPTVTATSAGTKPVGHTTYVWGSASALPEATVWTQVWVNDGWSTSQVGTTSTSGSYTLPLTYGASTPGVYRWRVGVATPDGGAVYSEEFTLARTANLTVYSAGVKATGTQTFTWGSLPGAASSRVFTQVLVNGSWSTSQIGLTSASGSFTLPLTYGVSQPGTYTYRVGVVVGTTTVYSDPFTLQRVGIKATTPANIDPLATATISGTTMPGATVRSRVLVDGSLSTSRIGTADAEGRFSLPFAYGMGRLGTYSYVVQVQVGTDWLSTPMQTITRARWANPTITPTTAAEVSSTYRSGCPTGPSRLSTVRLNYVNFDGQVRRGEIIVRSDLANRVANSLSQGIYTDFRFRQITNPNAFGGDDPTMMAADNTSGFNCRKVVGNPYALSPHAYGIAVDINPVENPYRDPTGKWWPSATYAYNRPSNVMGLMSSSTSVVKSMQVNGFRWESGWDWHHFQYQG